MHVHRRLERLGSQIVSGSQSTKISSSIEGEDCKASGDAVNEYDYIVVGGGSAGCVVASRLAEDPRVSVLLLEAGRSDSTLAIDIPASFMDLQLTDLDWQLKTVPQKNLNQRVVMWPRGKVLGGCSAINAMMYVRGDPRSYDRWARELGCEGWDYRSILKYFKKMEDFKASVGDPSNPKKRITDPNHELIQNYHGTKGWLTVTNPTSANVWTTRLIQASVESGVPLNPDINGAFQTGVSMGFNTIRNGVRDSTAHGYIRRSGTINKKNFTLSAESLVEKVVFHGDLAVGVVFRKGKRLHYAHAKKEVVLTAGAVHTPWLLLNSGVGPSKHLGELGVPLVKDLPVGENLQDHLMAGFQFEVLDQSSLDGLVSSRLYKLFKFAEYQIYGTGLDTCGTDLAFFERTGLDKSPENDTQIILFPVSSRPEIREKIGVEDIYQGKSPPYGITILGAVLLPKSKGTIRLNPKNLKGGPVVDPRYLENPYDMQVLVHTLKWIRRIVQAPCLKSLIGKETINQTVGKLDPNSDDYLRAHIRSSAVTIYHPASTCRMGPAADPNAVVDPQLRVKGIKRLRIADASVMPTIISGNTNAPTIMIAEKAADLIKSS